MSYNPLSVVAQYFPFDDFMFTYNLAAGTVAADVGKAMTLDATGSNKMKLTGAGDVVMGKLFQLEDRTQQGGGLVGTVERKLRAKLPAVNGHATVIGEQVEGSATAGQVTRSGTQPAVGARLNRCIETGTDYVVIELF